ncbi:hypothetical protein CC1G_04118 [Coprinopsis cinerea okayama7|uniref:Uncharacterized protein n=1 Tax=Coprinopsis cinerea (strain Okayama-7 / 130 / ATCC MYA-4618 / FGSC 9003) TaxID=240176 RepID=A8NW19_COPC7|nr:hypothetical protein CC1G_04118 [Coprinopsis cinerea okayama7\|eukprot:XP_001836805.1 hypothetical protein CC1G_04118 [Coprinopsis cinerea okayama7\
MAGAWSPGGKMNFYGDYTERFKRWFARTGTDASLDLSLDLHAGEADPMNLAEWIHDLRTRWRVLEIKHPFNFDYPDVSNRSIGQWSQLSSLTFPFKNFRNSSRLPPAHYKIYPLLSQMPVLRSLDLDLTHLDAGEELAFLSPVAVQRQRSNRVDIGVPCLTRLSLFSDDYIPQRWWHDASRVKLPALLVLSLQYTSGLLCFLGALESPVLEELNIAVLSSDSYEEYREVQIVVGFLDRVGQLRRLPFKGSDDRVVDSVFKVIPREGAGYVVTV